MAVGGSVRLAKMRSSLTKQSSSGVHVFEFALEHVEDILNIAFRHVWYLHTRTLWQSRVCVAAYSGQFMFWGDLIKAPAAVAGVDRLCWIRWFVAVICYVVDAEFCENPFWFGRVMKVCSWVYCFPRHIVELYHVSSSVYINDQVVECFNFLSRNVAAMNILETINQFLYAISQFVSEYRLWVTYWRNY